MTTVFDVLGGRLKSLKLLLVEDCDILQQIQVHMFQSLGHNVFPVSNGKKALEISKLTKFDLILMDLVMPEMDGFECAKQLRAMNVKTPIVALSGNDTPETVEACFAAGMNGFLKKPTNRNAFESMVNQVIA